MMRDAVEWPQVYAGKYNDEKIRKRSRSGGVFTALSDITLSSGGVVYGCILSDDFTAVHYRADSAAERDKMRGSKYIQSNIGETFRTIKADLNSGIDVLFSGTSCQVAGLRGYLGKQYDNLFCVDIVCHGVPSVAVWKKYLKWQEEKANKKVTEVDFRNKKDFGWKAHVESLTMDDGSIVNSTVFTTLFYKHVALRPCCYECPYKDVIHPGDITIADYWGIEKAAPEFDDDKGVSLILVNNEKGKTKFEECNSSLVWEKTRLEDSMQPPLKAPFPQPKNRLNFWRDFREMEFEKIARKYGDYGAINRIKRKVKNSLKQIKKKLRG